MELSVSGAILTDVGRVLLIFAAGVGFIVLFGLIARFAFHASGSTLMVVIVLPVSVIMTMVVLRGNDKTLR